MRRAVSCERKERSGEGRSGTSSDLFSWESTDTGRVCPDQWGIAAAVEEGGGGGGGGGMVSRAGVEKQKPYPDGLASVPLALEADHRELRDTSGHVRQRLLLLPRGSRSAAAASWRPRGPPGGPRYHECPRMLLQSAAASIGPSPCSASFCRRIRVPSHCAAAPVACAPGEVAAAHGSKAAKVAAASGLPSVRVVDGSSRLRGLSFAGAGPSHGHFILLSPFCCLLFVVVSRALASKLHVVVTLVALGLL